MRPKCSGFTYIGVLMLVAISGIGLAGVGIVWHQDAQREREKELLFIGDEYRKAIGSYYESSQNTTKQYPKTLNDLILDKRFLATKRHIRKLYADPNPSEKAWGLVEQQGQIIGIYSLSKQKPIKIFGFQPQHETFSTASAYSDWKFIYNAGSVASNVENTAQ